MPKQAAGIEAHCRLFAFPRPRRFPRAFHEGSGTRGEALFVRALPIFPRTRHGRMGRHRNRVLTDYCTEHRSSERVPVSSSKDCTRRA